MRQKKRLAVHRRFRHPQEQRMRNIIASAIAVSCLAMAGSPAHGTTLRIDADELVPTGKGWGQRFEAARENGQAHSAKPPRGGGGSGNGIDYHGGPVMLGAPN